MSDIKCVVCGEPWDSYGITHGDMLPWEAKLFRAGAGCPSCEGNATKWVPTTIADVENGDEDPMDRILALEAHADGRAPKWERPADPIHWTCAGCGVQVVTDVDDNKVRYESPCGSKGRQWWNSHDYDSGCPEVEPHATLGKDHYCEFCTVQCEHCGCNLSPQVEGDVYDPGYALPYPGSHTDYVCIDCLSEVEEKEAQEVWRTCYTAPQRIAYMRRHWSQFERCHAEYYPADAWRNMLACARGNAFFGYASELLS